jgi:ubiquinone/menaquinone biosynthesis C-methylase UbiE
MGSKNAHMKRTVTPELLDTDSGTPVEVATALADLRRINRLFGGIATTEEMVRRVTRAINASTLSLEVAAGSGYVPETVSLRQRNYGLRLDVTLLDRAMSHLCKGNRAVVADALALPFRQGSFDLLSCTLFAHHLGPQEFLQFTEEALRVCRVAVLINDIVRHPLHLSLVYAGLPLFRSRITRHDGPVSIRRAYTPEEMQTLLAQSTAARTEFHRHYLFRVGVIAWKY